MSAFQRLRRTTRDERRQPRRDRIHGLQDKGVSLAQTVDRFTGSLLGLAVGDAVGTTVEFSPPGMFARVTDMVGGGPFHLDAGQWTDDTAMALCLATSLLECDGFDPDDQMRRYVRWWHEGYLSCTGSCFDIGGTVRGALSRFERTGEAFSGSTDPQSAGNGSIMRLAPVALFYASEPAEALKMAAQSSRTTHGADEAVDACRLLTAILLGAIAGRDKEEILSSGFTPSAETWQVARLAPRIAEISDGSYKDKSPPGIRGTGYVVESLEAALWAFYTTETFREGCLAAANLGNDADTTAAIFGQIAGAHYGRGAIPDAWIRGVAWSDEISLLATRLFQASGLPS